jgi:serine/threonine-protein kinase
VSKEQPISTPGDSAGRRKIPERLGKYEVLSVLGKGAMGIVYKAVDPVIRRQIAIKTIRKELVAEDNVDNFEARFRNEAHAAGSLNHPGIVAVYDYGEVEDVAYIAMEYVEGNSLRDYFIKKVHFLEQDVISIMGQLLDAIQYAHERGVLHRDIKPANIIIMSSGRVKITDFGIARVESSNLTQVGVIMGTPGFMAPEQYIGEELDLRVDVFAAGVVLYQLLTGTAPFTGTGDAIMYKVCHEDPPLPSNSSSLEHILEFDPIVQRALAKRADNRYASAREFRDAILEAYGKPVSPTISEQTVILQPIRAPQGASGSGAMRGSSLSGAGSQPAAAGSAASAGSTAPASSATASASAAAARRGTGSTTGSTGSAASMAATGSSGSSGSLGSLGSLGASGSTIPTSELAQLGWDIPYLAMLEKELAQYVGAFGRVLVRRAARQTGKPEELVQRIAEQLSDEGSKQGFLRFARGSGPSIPKPEPLEVPTVTPVEAPAAEPEAQAEAEPLTPQTIEQAARALTVLMGPIARVLVRKALTPDVSKAEFLQRLAEHVAVPAERDRFLSELSRTH